MSAPASFKLPSASSFEEWCTRWDAKLAGNALIKPIEDATKQRRSHIFLGLVGVVSLVIILICGMEFLSNVFGLLPVYASIRAIKSPDKKDDTQWLVYWVVFAVMQVVESFYEDVLDDDDDDDDDSLILDLLYYPAKIGFLFWMGSTQFRGAELLYSKVIEPVFAKIEPIISSKRS